MSEQQKGIRTLEAWDQLLTAMEDAGEEDLEALRDFYVLHMAGGLQVWPEISDQLCHAAELVREVLKVLGKDKIAEVKA